MAMCKRRRDCYPEKPGNIVLDCRRRVNENGKHTGMHVTTDGNTQWCGKGKYDFDADDECEH